MNYETFANTYQSDSTDKILLDVRKPEEYSEGNLTGSINIPVQVLEERFSELEKSKKIYIYCRSGGRAQKAVEILKKNSFEKIEVCSEGGFEQLTPLIK